MKELILTKGLFAKVDDDVYVDLIQWDWCANKGANNKHFYASRGERYDGKVKRIFLHRYLVGALPGDKVKFKDKNPLNCQKSNLLHIRK